MAELLKTLATTRERRANAGAHMSRLLDKEEEDEFYKTQYGGFDEVENDNDFLISDSSDSENVIDSDFDIDETADFNPKDEDHEEQMIQQEEKRERRAAAKRKSTYREPIMRKPTGRGSSTITMAKPETSKGCLQQKTTKSSRTTRTSIVRSGTRKTILRSDDQHSMYKNLRESTKKSSRETKENLEDERRRKLKLKSKCKRKQPYRQPTQEERLREAKRTEIENMRSLEAYKNMEIEKSKRNKMTKKLPNVPLIRFHSYSDLVDSHGEDCLQTKELCYRTIISFPNEELFNQYFGRYRSCSSLMTDQVQSQQPRKRATSVLSNLLVRYKDPLTEFPYAKAKEFSVIRDAYVRYLEQSSLKDESSIRKFIESNRLLPSIELKISNQKINPQQQPTMTTATSNSSTTNGTSTPGLMSTSTSSTLVNSTSNLNEFQDSYKYRTLKTKIQEKKPVSVFVITTNKNKSQVQQVPASHQGSSLSSNSKSFKGINTSES